jgi:hypothetical protein
MPLRGAAAKLPRPRAILPGKSGGRVPGFVISAVFRVEGNDARVWGTVTDFSLHGCYVEMNTMFPAGTKVALVLKSFGIRIETPGTVRAPRTPSWAWAFASRKSNRYNRCS